MRIRSVWVIGMCLAGASVATVNQLTPSLAASQIPAVNPQIRHARGQQVFPIFEGWFRAADGSVHVSFGYVNRNTEEVVNAAVGPDNKVEPGPADQGQPTRFLPGRHFGIFTVPVPADRPKTELTWTLTANGRPASIPANLDPLYLIDPLKEPGGAHPGNLPPTLKFAPDETTVAQGPSGRIVTRTATLGTPLSLEVWVADDGLPPPAPPRAGTAAGRGGVPPAGTINTNVPRGLSVTWSQYRGPGTVTFAPATPPVAQGKATTAATFSEPGDYMLRVLASDGSAFSGQCCWTNGYLRIQVAGQRR